MTAVVSRLPLCADISRQAGEDPIGTAPFWQEVTVLELDIPQWAQLRNPDAWTDEQRGIFEALRGRVEASGAGFGLLMSAPATRGAPLRVRHYRQGPGGFVRRDYLSSVSQDEWARGLHDTLLNPRCLQGWTEQDVSVGSDFHVCTHGTVDAACGKYGAPVHQALDAAGVRAWRTGHFGGHRFAATAVELPSGYLWAHLSPDLALRVAAREVHPAELRAHLRGFAGLPPLAQVVDRELLMRHGWAWTQARRRAEIQGTEVRLHYDLHGRQGTVRATVEEAAALRLPGSSHKPERTDVRQYCVTAMDQDWWS
ncbi:sucrase ferredoxin [Deinococcus deserti]|uniref:Putative sucrase/ferredoxin-like protein n=1 Tax=Deinococcus deserti (strain DSM 17065 / CIP 109153 / LMG 22923 / VCD115) TaxID=546414 RepID=C1D2Q3_DEIDV|nr:sucrase ferredoxin [Deinococcus deserti]ACO47692.1 putative sucrase/ferredoxin-like protein [Deinococcus deserti VCD115]